jgi:heme/copper-type cytochrome/quinol oxidase subunit 2
MKQLVVVTGTAVLGVWAWLVIASLVYCSLTGKRDLLAFPYSQWAEAAPWWRANWLMTVCVTASAVLPTLLAVALGVIVWRFRRARRPALYGRSAWAGDAAMRAGGVRQSRTLPR